MKIKLLFFALMVGLGVKAQVTTVKLTGGGLTSLPQFVGKGDITTDPCFGNGNLALKTVSGEVVYPGATGCTPLSGKLIKGKIVVLPRPLSGECGTVARAIAAQDSGAIAVIIVNNITVKAQYTSDSAFYASQGAPLTYIKANVTGFINYSAGSGTSCAVKIGNKLKIPLVQMSKELGDQVIALVNGGTKISASVGFNLYDYDLSINKAIALPLYRTRPASMVKAKMVHDSVGFVMYNRGAKDIKNVVANLEVNQIDDNDVETPFFKDSVLINEIQSVGGKEKSDTLYVRYTFKPGKDLTKGDYVLRWKLRTAGVVKPDTLLEQNPIDNIAQGYFTVTDSVLSVAAVTRGIQDGMTVLVKDANGVVLKNKAGKDSTIVNLVTYDNELPSLYAFLPGNTSKTSKKINDKWQLCQIYESDYAQGLSISSLTFWAKRNAKDSLLGAKFTVSAHLWTPSVPSIYSQNYGIVNAELIPLGTVDHTVTSFQGTLPKRIMAPIEVKFPNPIKLKDKGRYLVCVSTKDTVCGLGFARTSVSTEWSQKFNNRFLSPVYGNEADTLKTGSQWYYTGLGYDYITSLAVKVLGTSTSSIKENADVTNNLNVYPNPSTGTFKFVADAGALSVSVTDLSGKTVYNYENKNHNELVHTIELENVYTGMYIAKIVNNGVMSVVKLQVAK